MRHRSSNTPEPDPWSSIPVVANQWRRMLSRQSPGELDMAVTYVCRKCGGETKRTVKRARRRCHVHRRDSSKGVINLIKIFLTSWLEVSPIRAQSGA